jgi:hypothetical protein
MLAHLLRAGLLLGLASLASAQAPPAVSDSEALGEHWRIETERGAIHLWRPQGYDPRTAGVVVYLHGYYTRVDQTWRDDNLAQQFEASGRNALFIVPETPNSSSEVVQWPFLAPLLETVRESATVPTGPVVVVGHSGAFRTIVDWLRDGRVKDVILLDALYQHERDFFWWLLRAPGHATNRLVLVALETLPKAERFVRRLGRVPQRVNIPETDAEFTPAERHARVLLLRSQYEHMELVTSGKVMPVLLKLLPLRPARPSEEIPAGTR